MEQVVDEQLSSYEKAAILKEIINLDPRDQKSWDFIKLLWIGKRTQLFQNLEASEALNLVFLEGVTLFFDIFKKKPDLVTPSASVKALVEAADPDVATQVREAQVISLDKFLADLRLKLKKNFVFSTAGEISDIYLSGRENNPDLVLGQLDRLRDSLKSLDQGPVVEYQFGQEHSSSTFGAWEGERRFASPLQGLFNFFGTKRLYIFGGGYGEGKTHLAINMASALYSQGLNVLHISLEIPLQEVLVRYIGQEEGLLLDDIGNLPQDDLHQKLSAINGKGRGKLIIYETPELNVVTLKTYLLGKNFDVVVIDYMDLMEGSTFSKDDNLFRVYGQISRDLYNLAKEMSLCIIAMTQLNRPGAMSEDPSSAHLSRSIGKAEAADAIVIMKTVEKNNQLYLRLKTDKLRHWKQHQVVYVPIDYARGKVFLDKGINVKDFDRVFQNNKKAGEEEVLKETNLLSDEGGAIE